MIQEIHCFATGGPGLSRSVDLKASFKRWLNSGKDQEGSGAAIQCIITCHSSCYNSVLQCLKEMEGHEKLVWIKISRSSDFFIIKKSFNHLIK